MTAPAIFDYSGQQVRTVVVDSEPWFVAADIAAVLGYSATAAMTRSMDDDEKGVRILHTPGGVQEMVVISEPGLFGAILRSQIPQARAFKRWVTHDVLPAIRRTGAYVVPQMSGPELLAHAVIEAQAMIAAKDERIAELAPKADLADAYLDADGGDRLAREAAKLLGMRERDLRRFLLDEGLLFLGHSKCGVPQYDFYSRHADHFVAREKVVEHSTGMCSHYTVRITPRGMDLIRRRLQGSGLVALRGGAA